MLSKSSSCANRYDKWLAFAIITAVGIFYFSTIREMDGWGDFAQYLHHAKNIATGVPYAETGYIYNPFYSTLGPSSYPPVYPILLSAVYRIFPENLKALRIEMICLFLTTLWIIFLNFRQILKRKDSIAALLCVGFNPQFWEYKDKIVSDIPFVLFTYLALFVIHRSYSSIERMNKWNGVLTGVLTYLAYGTRSIGLVLVLSLLVYDLLRNRKLTPFAGISCLVFLLFASLQTIYLPGAEYRERVHHISVTGTLSNLLIYAKYAAYFWDNGYSKLVLHIVAGIVFFFSAAGILTRMRQEPTIYEIFTLFLAAVLVVYPAQHHRYLFPLIPLCLMYAYLGIRRFARISPIGDVVRGSFLALILVSYTAKYTTVQYSAPPEGVHKKEAVELFKYVTRNTSEKDVLIFRRPRALAFYTGRKASVYHRTESTNPDLWNYFYRIHATHIIESYFDDASFRRFVALHQNSLEKVYSNRDFTVYRIRSYPTLHD